jgi:predicted nucleic-acid-binding Zn-ribbon protein
MALTQKQQQAIGDWLAHHATIARCPACGLQEHHPHEGAKKTWWTVSNDLYGLPSLAPGAAQPSLDLHHGQVFASVHCNRCGYVMLFHERTISNPVP